VSYQVWSDYDGCRVDNAPRFVGTHEQCIAFMRRRSPPRGYDRDWNLVNATTNRCVSYVL
jgi:hypothetical protein